MPIQDAPPYPMIMPEEVWRGSTPDAIDAANAQPGIATPTTPEQDRFIIQRNEDERNASLGIDPLKARKAKVDAEESAIRFSGQQEFNQLVSGGATPEEALRRTAGKLFFNHPDKMAMALSRVPEAGAVPSTVNAVPITVGGKTVGTAVYDQRGRLHATQFQPTTVKPPPEIVAQERVNRSQMDSARRELEQARKDISKALDPQEKQDAARRALAAQNKLADLEKAYVAGTTNWMTPAAVNAPAAPATFRKGQRAKQNGITYEFDGQNWNPVSG